MFCGHCGTENENGVSFCKNCGKPLKKTTERKINNTPLREDNEAEHIAMNAEEISSQANVNESKPKSFPVKALAGVAAGILVLIIIIAIAANSKPTINLDDYVTFEASGYDGYGTVSYDIDWNAIDEKYGDKLQYTSKAREEAGEWLSLFTPVEALQESISIKIEPNTDLSNGNEVKYTWNVPDDISDDIKCKVKYSDGNYSVNGLDEVGSFDAFADIEVSFSGISPDGRADIQYNGSELSYYDFTVDKTSGLKNGDTIKITITNNDPDKYAQALGKVPESFEKEYEVSGLDEYVSSFADLDDAFVENLKKESEDIIYSYTASSYNKDVSLKDLAYAGYIVNTSKDNNGWGIYNNIYIIYSGDVSSTDGDFNTARVYYPVRFNNILKTSEGLSYNDNSGIQGSSYIDGRAGTRGYVNPLECYIDIVEKNRDSYNSECGDGFEVYADYELIEKLSDIGEQFKSELQADAKDSIENYIEKYSYGIQASDLSPKGEYLLTAKNQGTDFGKNNYYFVVYSATLSNEDDRFEPLTVYFPVEYAGIVKLPGDEYMVTKREGLVGNSNIPDTYYSTKGFVDGEEMFSKIVTANRDNYSYEVSEGLKEFGD